MCVWGGIEVKQARIPGQTIRAVTKAWRADVYSSVLWRLATLW